MINVSYGSTDPTEKLLSNLAPTPFTMDGQYFASVEGFWQGIKRHYTDPERAKIFLLAGISAKRAAPPSDFAAQVVWYAGKEFALGGTAHQQLLKRAIAHKLRSHPNVLHLLEATEEKTIIHDPKNAQGESYPPSLTIPHEVFAGFLLELREEFRSRTVPYLTTFDQFYSHVCPHPKPSEPMRMSAHF